MSKLVVQSTWRNPGSRKLEAVRACHERDLKTLLSLLDSYIDLRSRKGVATSVDTRASYRVAVTDWVHFCWPDPNVAPPVPILRATEEDVAYYLGQLQQQGGHLDGASGQPLAPGSASTYLAGVRAFYRALIWADALQDSPAQLVPTPSDPRPRHERRPALPVGDYQELLAQVEVYYADDPARRARTRLLIRLLGDQGLRVSEAVHLWVDDIDLRNAQLYVRKGKGGKSRTIPLTQSCQQALTAWLQVRTIHAQADEPALLVNVGKKVKKARLGRAMHVNTVRLELDRFYKQLNLGERYRGAHVLRHTAGTRLYHHTRDLHVVSQVLGHSDINTSSIYAKMDQQGLRDAMQNIGKDDQTAQSSDASTPPSSD